MSTWTRKPQEQEGKYRFSGTFYVTQGVHSKLSQEEILGIYLDIQVLVKEMGGIDYFQVYENESGDKLYFIDQCDAEMMAEESFKEEFNHCTLLFSHEY
jgi:hypothetical protein